MTNIMILDVTENIGYSPNSWPLINMMIYQWIELGTLFSDNHFVRKILYLKKDLQEFGGFDDQDGGWTWFKIWVFRTCQRCGFNSQTASIVWWDLQWIENELWTPTVSPFFPIFHHFLWTSWLSPISPISPKPKRPDLVTPAVAIFLICATHQRSLVILGALFGECDSQDSVGYQPNMLYAPVEKRHRTMDNGPWMTMARWVGEFFADILLTFQSCY